MEGTARQLIDALRDGASFAAGDYLRLLESAGAADVAYARSCADALRVANFGSGIYLRGLVEFTSYCRNDCYYCGLRRGNAAAVRYRLTAGQILDCLEQGYAAGLRTLVLQGGEDPFFDDDRMCAIVSAVKGRHPDVAVTLSLGERSRESYRRLREAGADRYLLRHETATAWHYARLHPAAQRLESRMQCLRELQELGFQVGCGMMVGSPGQTLECLANDLAFIRSFRPQMVGLGPFIPHHATPFANEPPGTVEQTLWMLALVRLSLPKVLLPATTALATLRPAGRLEGIRSGANVIMPNLSPVGVRDSYSLYDHKANTGAEAVEGVAALARELETIGCHIDPGRGDAPN